VIIRRPELLLVALPLVFAAAFAVAFAPLSPLLTGLFVALRDVSFPSPGPPPGNLQSAAMKKLLKKLMY